VPQPPAGEATSRTTSRSETPPDGATETGQPTATTGPTQASADVNAAGPDDGPPCAVAKQYSDEAPTGLRPDVKAAWVATKKRAAALGVTLCLNDGKRSAAQQVALFKLYVKKYGTAAAHDYVLPPGKSAHVKGYAVDVQPASAYRWLQGTKGKLGWCRIYDNEAWHFEYSTVYASSGCPVRQPQPLG
jgi:D-alanyl-D-alanine carboxypeptidase